MWELDHRDGWALKKRYLRIVVQQKTFESPLESKEIKPVNPKGNQPEYSLEGLMLKLKLQTLATWCKEPTHQKTPWCWERLKAAGEGDDRGWDGWMVSLTQRTWVWANSGRWWRTGKPGVLQSMGLQRVRHDWATEQQHPLCSVNFYFKYFEAVNGLIDI